MSTKPWMRAHVYFRESWNLGKHHTAEEELRNVDVWMNESWLHIRLSRATDVISVPASAVERVEWDLDR